MEINVDNKAVKQPRTIQSLSNGSTFLNNIDKDRVSSLMGETEENVKYFDGVCIKVANSYSETLDNIMSDLYVDCIKTRDASTPVLENYYLELANTLYFYSGKLEQLGIYDDVSKSAAKEIYSKSYLTNQVKEVDGKNKTTVSELQAQAELDAQYHLVVNNIYDRAYNILKNKMAAAQDMLNTIRKILSQRQAELNLSTYSNNTAFNNRNRKSAGEKGDDDQ